MGSAHDRETDEDEGAKISMDRDKALWCQGKAEVWERRPIYQEKRREAKDYEDVEVGGGAGIQRERNKLVKAGDKSRRPAVANWSWISQEDIID